VVPRSETRGPLTDAVILNLFPVDPERGPAVARVNRLPVIPMDAYVVFILGTTAEEIYSEYRVRCRRRSGVRLWPDRPLRRDPTGSFSVILPRKDLPETSWSIEIYGLAAGMEKPLETFRVEPAEGIAP
jgi:hypothetical protein